METRMCQPDGQRPPALPVKQHRSRYSSSSADLESEEGLYSPLVSQLQSPAADTDVFSGPTDCQAAACPIHQRYDPSLCHQERFFSDTCPPPVPKKKMTRTLSLPGIYPCPLSPSLFSSQPPLSPAQYSPHSYDNPLYMTLEVRGPLEAWDIHQRHPLQRPPLTLLPLSQLSFDTPDQILPEFFCSFTNLGAVNEGLQQRHLLFLRSMVESLEAGQLLGGRADEVAVAGGAVLPQEFFLCGDYQPCQIGGALYYHLQSPKFPGRVLAAKVSSGIHPSPHPTPGPAHINIQQVLTHYLPCSQQECNLNTSHTQKPTETSQSGCVAQMPSHEDSVEINKSQNPSRDTRGPTVVSLLQRGYTVTLERDLPQATLEDFVEEGRGLQGAEALAYERQLCVLLLQLARGLQHLDKHGACTCMELNPQDALLLWPEREGSEGGGEGVGERKQETVGNNCNAVESEQGSGTRTLIDKNDGAEKMESERKQEFKVGIGELWRKWGSPRLVVSHRTALSLPVLPTPTLRAQFGTIIQYCHHPHEDGAPPASLYRRGLLLLSGWLQDEGSGMQIADTVGVLQALLWGPQAGLFSLNPAGAGLVAGSATSIVDHWLNVKRTLLVLKLAEKGLVQNQSGLDWEDCLCLNYLSLTDSESVVKATTRLGLHNTAVSPRP